MKKLSKILAMAGCCVLASCSTIVFENGPQSASAQSPIKLRHHTGGIFELKEFSEPKDLQKICNGKSWSNIKTEQTFVDGLIRQVVPLGIYSPRTTYTSCES